MITFDNSAWIVHSFHKHEMGEPYVIKLTGMSTPQYLGGKTFELPIDSFISITDDYVRLDIKQNSSYTGLTSNDLIYLGSGEGEIQSISSVSTIKDKFKIQ